MRPQQQPVTQERFLHITMADFAKSLSSQGLRKTKLLAIEATDVFEGLWNSRFSLCERRLRQESQSIRVWSFTPTTSSTTSFSTEFDTDDKYNTNDNKTSTALSLRANPADAILVEDDK